MSVFSRLKLKLPGTRNNQYNQYNQCNTSPSLADVMKGKRLHEPPNNHVLMADCVIHSGYLRGISTQPAHYLQLWQIM